MEGKREEREKFEARNPKSETNSNNRNSKFKTVRAGTPHVNLMPKDPEDSDRNYNEPTNIFGVILQGSKLRFEHLNI